MIVRTLETLDPSRTVAGDTWTSRRLLLRADGMGFSVHDTLIHPGTSTHIHYQNHLEAVYCIDGEGSIKVLGTGETYPITPGTIYALDQNDEHVLSAVTRLRMVCVFNPGIVGPETHDEDGVYPLLDDDGQRRDR